MKNNIVSAIIRECFPESILLGSVEKPLKITEQCNPVNIESDGSIAACICTNDYCNDADFTLAPVPDEDNDKNEHNDDEVIDEIDITPNEPETTSVVSTSTSTAAPRFNKIICHQCGSLFSNKNSNCDVFDDTDKSQQGFCEPGEACLWTTCCAPSTGASKSSLCW